MAEQDEPVVVDQFMAEVLQASVRNTISAHNAAWEGMAYSAAIAEITLDMIRLRVLTLIDGDYMPSTHALTAALYPPYEEVRAAATQMLRERFPDHFAENADG